MVEFLGMFKRQFGGINMKYSIIYGVIRPEIAEQLSVGIIIVDGDEISVRYSTKKMNVMKALYTESEYKFLGRVLRSLSKNGSIQSTDVINYLARYSNTPEPSFAVATTCVSPCPTAVTTPFSSTVTMLSSEDFHVTERSNALSGFTTTVSWKLSAITSPSRLCTVSVMILLSISMLRTGRTT